MKRWTYKFYLNRGHLLPITLRSIYIQDVTDQIFQQSVPKTYSGHVVLLCYDEHSKALKNETYKLTWDQLAIDKFEIDYILGRHLDIVKEPHVSVLAEELRFYLDRMDHSAKLPPNSNHTRHSCEQRRANKNGGVLNERLRRKRTEYHFATSHTLRGSASLNSAHSDCCASCAPRGGELTRSD